MIHFYLEILHNSHEVLMNPKNALTKIQHGGCLFAIEARPFHLGFRIRDVTQTNCVTNAKLSANGTTTVISKCFAINSVCLCDCAEPEGCLQTLHKSVCCTFMCSSSCNCASCTHDYLQHYSMQQKKRRAKLEHTSHDKLYAE